MSKRSGIAIGSVLFVLAVVAAGLSYKFILFWMSTPQDSGPTKTIFYEVHPQDKPMTVARELEKLGVVSSARMFYWYGRLTGKTKKFRAGDYRFTNRMRPDEVLAIIMSGISYGLPLTIPEGYNIFQISELLENLRAGSGEKFLKLAQDKQFVAGLFRSLGFEFTPPTLEGYLFPDTYLIGRKSSEEEIARGMVRKFKEIYTPELSARAKAIGMTDHEVMTLASIVEKETGAKQERPLISSVFHNRLKKRMKLQTDPTVIYGIKNYNGNISRKDLETPTPYNTYVIKGLPPTPIANPGKEAILAALFPADSEFLFFVSHNDGTHEFTKTFDDHRKAVGKFQLDPKAREGKSWRDLNKKAN